MRRIFLNQDLRGQTLDASLELDSNARESFFADCLTDINTRFIGDWRGSDFFRLSGPADWSQAQVYACYWRGNTNLKGSFWPADIGWLHHEPVSAILQGSPVAIVRNVGNFVLTGGYRLASWDTSKTGWWDNASQNIKNKRIANFRAAFAPYPILANRFEELLVALQNGYELFTGTSGQMAVTWGDGVTITIDADNLPVLADTSRYALARWVELQAGPSHPCFIYSIDPPRPRALVQPDDWFQSPWGGF